MSDHKTTAYTYLSVAAVNVLGLAFGMAAAWASPILIKLQDKDHPDNPLGYGISDDQLSWIGSLLSLGTIVGTLPAGYLANSIGRKYTLLLMGILYFISFMLAIFGTIVELYYLLRILAGMGVAGSTFTSMYVSEVVHPKERAKLNTTVVMSISFGGLLPSILGPYLSIILFNSICAATALIFCIVFIFAPESPHYLIAKGKFEKALETLKKLRGTSNETVTKEFEEIKDYIQHHEDGSLRDVFKNSLLVRALLIALGLNLFAHLTGIMTVGIYTQEVFERAGTRLPSAISAIIVGVCNTIVNCLSIFFVQRFRFKLLMMLSFGGVAISQLFYGLFFFFKEATDSDLSNIQWLPVVTALVGAFSFDIGLAPLWGIMTLELFPTSVRSSAYALIQTIGSTLSFLMNKFYMDMNAGMGTYGTFWLFAVSSAIGVLFVKLYMIETNGKSFPEIQEILERKHYKNREKESPEPKA